MNPTNDSHEIAKKRGCKEKVESEATFVDGVGTHGPKEETESVAVVEQEPKERLEGKEKRGCKEKLTLGGKEELKSIVVVEQGCGGVLGGVGKRGCKERVKKDRKEKPEPEAASADAIGRSGRKERLGAKSVEK